VRKVINWGHAETSEVVRKLGFTGALVARFLTMTTASVNRMARPEEMTELDGTSNWEERGVGANRNYFPGSWQSLFAFAPTFRSTAL
jgi:hypothetical protein